MGRPRRAGPKPASGGVLLIQNVITGCTLVAGSREVRKRLSDHRQALRRGRHWNHALQRDYAANPSSFRFTVIRDRMHSVAVIRDEKRHHIQRLNVTGQVYNRCSHSWTNRQ